MSFIMWGIVQKFCPKYFIYQTNIENLWSGFPFSLLFRVSKVTAYLRISPFPVSVHQQVVGVYILFSMSYVLVRCSIADWASHIWNAYGQNCFRFQIFLILKQKHSHIHNKVAWIWDPSLNMKSICVSYTGIPL